MSGLIYAMLGGGFGNRLPVLVSAMRLADLYDRRLHVLWSEQAEMQLQLGDLFELEGLPFSTVTPTLGPHRTYPRFGDDGYLLEPARVEDLPAELDMVVNSFPFLAHHDDARTLDTEARDPFMASMGEYFRRLTLRSTIAKRVEDICARFDTSHALGIHIRRTAINSVYTPIDQGRAYWKLEWYAQAIDLILGQHPTLKHLYVASNSIEARDFIRSTYGDMVVTNDEAGDGWASAEFQKEAMVELMVLSRCAAILRQPGTTFSTFASVLECTPLITMRDLDPTTTQPVLEWSYLGSRTSL